MSMDDSSMICLGSHIMYRIDCGATRVADFNRDINPDYPVRLKFLRWMGYVGVDKTGKLRITPVGLKTYARELRKEKRLHIRRGLNTRQKAEDSFRCLFL